MPERFTISAPSRLHFGLFSVGGIVTHPFGGAGLMIKSPRTILSLTPAARFSIAGPSSGPCRKAIENWFLQSNPGCFGEHSIHCVSEIPARIEIKSVPLRHSGLGTGTQLAMCSVTALMRFLKLPSSGPDELAALAGRGKRSGIGSYGFLQGGFLVDRGKADDRPLAPLDFRTDFPTHWPVVTAIHQGSIGKSGNQELSAFKTLVPSSELERDRMINIVRQQMIPGVLQNDYDLFANGVFEFGRRSGMMYASVQDGAFNGPVVKNLVDRIRDFGVSAVGQSSWGPCVFAIARNDLQAQNLYDVLRRQHGEDCLITLTHADNKGARIIDE